MISPPLGCSWKSTSALKSRMRSKSQQNKVSVELVQWQKSCLLEFGADRADQLDDHGNLVRFFQDPPRPLLGPHLGPMGPFSRGQQSRPQPRQANPLFPPNLQGAAALPEPANAVQASSQAAQVFGLALVLARLFSQAQSTQETQLLLTVPSQSPVPQESTPNSPPSAVPPLAPAPPVVIRQQQPQRQSARLAARASGNFVDTTVQAVRRKALLNSLSGCSASLKKQVQKRNIPVPQQTASRTCRSSQALQRWEA